jgi:hypothetical protein
MSESQAASRPGKTKKRKLSYWIVPFVVQTVMCLILIITTFIIDKNTDGRAMNAFLNHFLNDDVGVLANILGGLTQVAPAILGLAITVIAIIVEMASNKYSAKVMDLFVNDPINFAVMTLFVVTSINSLWVAHIPTQTFFPFVSMILNVVLIIISLLIVIPYFYNIFNFLHPHNFIKYVEYQTTKLFDNLVKLQNNDPKIEDLKARLHENIDFIGDIAINSVVQGDRAVSQYCTNILKEICIYYDGVKKELPQSFFVLSEKELEDPDFIDFSEFVTATIQNKQIWFERKVLRMLEIIFNMSRENLRTVASGVLLDTMRIGEKACKEKDKNLIFTVMQQYNTFLRYAINNDDPRTAFNILEHYRSFGEALLQTVPEEVERVVFYFRYYALEAQKRHVLFILETAAHDISRLVEIAYETNSEIHKELLLQFLKLDQPLEENSNDQLTQQEMSLIGVRLAQVKLAAFYILNDRLDYAKLIFEDLRVEPMSRINTIREMINMNASEEYWEMTGRGINFFYVSPEQRESLTRFFEWFNN